MIVSDSFMKNVAADYYTIFQGMNSPESIMTYNMEDELPEVKLLRDGV